MDMTKQSLKQLLKAAAEHIALLQILMRRSEQLLLKLAIF